MATIRISSIRGVGGDGSVSIVGPTVVFPDSSNEYTITNYDSFSTYNITSSVGSVSRADDVITLSIPAGATGSTVTLSITRDGSTRVFQIGLGGTGVVTPSITSPANGTTGVPTTVTIQATAFNSVPSGAGEHLSSEWQVARDAGFSDLVVDVEVSEGNLTRYTASNLPRNTPLYARVKYIADIGESEWSSTTTFTTTDQMINQPTISIVGNDYDVMETPTFTSSAFSTTPPGSDTHVASNWVLRYADTEEVVWQLNHSTSNKLSVTIPAGVLEEDTLYTMEVQYVGGFGTSVFSDKLTFQTAQSFVPTEPGTPFGGGYYAGRIMVDGQEYALVVAPRAQGGQAPSRQWKTSQTTTAGANSRNDGWANTQAMITAGALDHPAANFCNNLSINGYNDWYLPSQDELEILYRVFKPTTDNNSATSGANPSAIPPTGNYTINNPLQTSVDIFKYGGGEDFNTLYSYWSSTQISSTSSRSQYFRNGNQAMSAKGSEYYARGVRRVAV